MASSEVRSLPVEFLYKARIRGLAEVYRMPGGPKGDRLLVPAISGDFEGPHLSGLFLPGLCADFATQSGDTYIPDVRLAMQTHDGTIIVATQTGRLSPFYTNGRWPGTWRVCLTFECGPGPYARLNEILAVGIGNWVTRDEIEYDVFVLL
ncbi:MAG: DUF3237 domain-containing protein [Acidobacteria bacterium]|nr:DUF3237 domain-containing protein [Acidobacteriota bacterium]